MTRNIYIYALRDPRNDEVRYIGKSNSIYSRLKQHLQDRTKGSPKVKWIKSLIQEGLTPSVKVLEIVDESKADEAELKWIKHYAKDSKLTNTALMNKTQKTAQEYERELAERAVYLERKEKDYELIQKLYQEAYLEVLQLKFRASTLQKQRDVYKLENDELKLIIKKQKTPSWMFWKR